MEKQKLWASLFVFMIITTIVHARPKSMELELEEREADPGWVRRQLIRVGEAVSRVRSGLANINIRRQLIRAGEAASRVSSGLGGYAVRLTNTVDRICKVIKKIIPIVGAVCTVGKFQFCALDNVTADMPGPSPIAGPGIVDLTVQD